MIGSRLFLWLSHGRLQRRFMLITGGGVLLLSICAMAMIAWFQYARTEDMLRRFSENELSSLHAFVLNVMAKRREDTANVGISVFNSWFDSRNQDYPGQLWSVWGSKTVTFMAQKDPNRTPKLPVDDIDREVLATGQPVGRLVDGAYRYSVPIVLGRTKGADAPVCVKCHGDLMDEKPGDVIAVFSSSLWTAQEYRQTAIMLGIMSLCAVLTVVLVVLIIRLILNRVIGHPLREMTQVMSSLADGELHVSVPGVQRDDEVGAMARAVEVFKKNAQDKDLMEHQQAQAELRRRQSREQQQKREEAIVREVAAVARAAAAGDLNQRIDLAGKDGFLHDLCQEVNSLIHLTNVALQDVTGVMTAVAQGNMAKRITNDYGGVFGQLTRNVNFTAAKLLDMMNSIKASSSRLKMVLETAAEGIFGIDADNRVIFANRAASNLLGWAQPEAMLGMNGDMALGHHLADGRSCNEGVCAIRQTIQDGQTRRVSGEFFSGAGGTFLPVEYTLSPLVVDGTIVGATMLFHDVSDKLRSEREIRRLMGFQRAILDMAGNAIVVVDIIGAVALFNQAASQLFGYGEHQIIGTRTLELRPAAEEGDIPTLAFLDNPLLGLEDPLAPLAAVDVNVPYVGEWSALRRDGSRVPILLSAAALEPENGDVTGYILVAQDISSLKTLELDLKRSNTELERFAYVASHDLRQPLRMITSYLGLIERRLKSRLDDEEQSFIAHAVGGAKRMDRMINDLLQYSRIGRVGGDFQMVDLRQMAQDALDSLGLTIQDCGAQVVIDGDWPQVRGSASELERLLQNLMSNAVKFRAPDRSPVIRVDCRDAGAEWEIMVQDNGIGIDPSQQDRLFNIFQRLVPREEYEGNGIGLASCRKIVEHHHGRIWIESAPDQGSTFRFTLPKVMVP